MTAAGLSFVHRFEPGTTPGHPPILLLHGTGGDENQRGIPAHFRDRAGLDGGGGGGLG